MSKTNKLTAKRDSDEQPADGRERRQPDIHAVDRLNPDRFAKAKPEYIRIARALIGTTPAQLAAQIGTRPGISTADAAGEPARTPDGLAAALRVVIGWYEDRFATKARAEPPAPDTELADLEDLVRRYITLRADWESREAVRLAAAMREESGRLSAGRFSSEIALEAGLKHASEKDPSGEPALARTAAPWIAEDAPPAQAFVDVASIKPERRTALLVDDASDVVVTVGAFLESFGFDVVRASSGDMALQFLAEGTPMDLLVTDHAMPGMTGRDLAVQALQLRPGLRALIITGFPDAAELGKLPPGVYLLAKPFRRAELSARIATLLGGGQDAGASPAMAGAFRSV